MEYYYDYETSSSGWAFWWIVWLAFFIRSIVCMWKVFKKAGRKWRESLIPIRNIWVLFKISGHKKWFRWLFIVPLAWIIVSIIFRLIWTTWTWGQSLIVIKNAINWILGICATILPLIAVILLCLWLSKKFGKHWAFCLWLLFLSPIFYGILAFDDSKYNS